MKRGKFVKSLLAITLLMAMGFGYLSISHAATATIIKSGDPLDMDGDGTGDVNFGVDEWNWTRVDVSNGAQFHHWCDADVPPHASYADVTYDDAITYTYFTGPFMGRYDSSANMNNPIGCYEIIKTTGGDYYKATFTEVVRDQLNVEYFLLPASTPNQEGNQVGDDVLTLPMNSEASISPMLNDMDPDGDTLIIEGLDQPQHGTAEVINGVIIYTPDPGYSGEDVITYYVTDGRGWHGEGKIWVTVWAPLPPLNKMGDDPDSVVRGDAPETTVITSAEVFGRVLVENGKYIRPVGEIGNPAVINLGVLQAVEVFGVNSGGSAVSFQSGVTVCLKGEGKLIYFNAANMPRIPEWLPSFPHDGFTCGIIPNAGTLVLVP
ncbi:MAG TPA: Ig-like domain-containing protein [Aggregatilineaceae bacterium]|nr:Ig-like domain-containing protein [Aggregatilineaceae bacterium]